MYVKKLYPQIYNDILPLLGCQDFVEQAHLRNKIHNISKFTHYLFSYITIFFETNQAIFVSSITSSSVDMVITSKYKKEA